jgi:hypothetical protein
MLPVCGDCMENGVTERIKLATAPTRAASNAPRLRMATVSP